MRGVADGDTGAMARIDAALAGLAPSLGVVLLGRRGLPRVDLEHPTRNGGAIDARDRHRGPVRVQRNHHDTTAIEPRVPVRDAVLCATDRLFGPPGHCD